MKGRSNTTTTTSTTHTTDTTHYHTGSNVVDVVCGRCGSTSVRGVKT